MPKLIALKRLRHPRGGTDGKEYLPGDAFEASERDAKAYTLVRAARLDDRKPRGRPPKVAEPEQPPAVHHAEQPPAASMTTQSEPALVSEEAGYYGRRDMRAVD